MAKSFDIIMAGVISGIVALTTTYLGVGGTVIGAVLGSIIYQILSIFLKEPLEKKNIRRFENEVVYIIPLVLIAILLAIFILSYFFDDFTLFYLQLRDITDNNLLTLMGLGLMIMGVYPLFQSNNIKKSYGGFILVLGFILLFRGLLPGNPMIFEFYDHLDGPYDSLSTCVLIGLVIIIFKIFFEALNYYNKNKIQKTENITSHENRKNVINNNNYEKEKNGENKEDKGNYICQTQLNNTIEDDKTNTLFEHQNFFKKKK